MPQKIKGDISGPGRIITIDESNWGSVETNTVVTAGSYDIEVPASGTKTVIARSNSGEVLSFSGINSVYEAPGFVDYSQDFTVNSGNYNDGYIYGGSTYKYREWEIIMGRFNTYRYDAWFWFTNVTIPQGATILSAVLKGQVRTASTGTSSLTMYCAAQANAGYPSSFSNYNSIGTTTGTDVSVYTGAQNTIYSFPDMKNEVQTVINYGVWNSGNNLLVMPKHDDSRDWNAGFRITAGQGASDYGYAYPTLSVSWRVYG